jgi:hypothetical protein
MRVSHDELADVKGRGLELHPFIIDFCYRLLVLG